MSSPLSVHTPSIALARTPESKVPALNPKPVQQGRGASPGATDGRPGTVRSTYFLCGGCSSLRLAVATFFFLAPPPRMARPGWMAGRPDWRPPGWMAGRPDWRPPETARNRQKPPETARNRQKPPETEPRLARGLCGWPCGRPM